jgi:hypothetical protein
MAGLAVAAFTIVDRLARGRPRLSVIAAKDKRDLRISNDASYHIAILNWSVHPAVDAVAEGATVGATTRAAAGRSFKLMMAPHTERSFPLTLLFQNDKPLDRAHKWALVVLHWRKGTSLWLPQIPVWTLVPTAIVRSLRTRDYNLSELEPQD